MEGELYGSDRYQSAFCKTAGKGVHLVDGDGMFLLIHPNGSKYWRFRFRFGGKQHLMAFGVYPETSLADARQKGKRPESLLLLASILVNTSVL
jgi:hypothetical protein